MKKLNKVGSIFLLLLSGLSRACTARSGGLISIYMADASTVNGFTLNAGDGTYSAVSMTAGSVFYKFDFKQDTGQWKDSGKNTNGAFSVEHMISSYWEGIDPVTRARAQDIADSSTCGLIIIAVDANARKVVLGYNEKFQAQRPMKLDTQNVDTGKAFTDQSGSEVSLKSTDNEYARFFTGTIPV